MIAAKKYALHLAFWSGDVFLHGWLRRDYTQTVSLVTQWMPDALWYDSEDAALDDAERMGFRVWEGAGTLVRSTDIVASAHAIDEVQS